jgi:CBS domain containing-hemolysin-like protein
LKGQTEPWKNLADYRREPLMIPETQKVSRLFEIMRENRAHMALVMDEYGAFSGLVTLEDLLEEIVGEIEDESDRSATKYVIKQTETGWEAHGLVPLADLERMTGLTVGDTLDVNTLSGLFMERLERMTEVGDSIEEDGFLLRAEEIEDNYVSRVAIERKPIVEAPLADGADHDGRTTD